MSTIKVLNSFSNYYDIADVVQAGELEVAGILVCSSGEEGK